MSASGELASARWEALGTSAVLLIADARALQRARPIVERELELIDRTCSRFRADSELQRANAGAGRFVPVSPLLIEAVEVALRAAELTDGDVDPTLGRALELAGYDRDWALMVEAREEPERSGVPGDCARPVPDELAARWRRSVIRARARPRWRAIEIDRARCAIRLPGGVCLDLGATAKAWAADRAASAVHRATGAGALISLGGDIATCGTAPDGGWQIHVTDDHRSAPGAPGQTISIASGGLATSSTAVRRWSHRGQVMHHIIDPATGTPATLTWRTVSVAAASCLDANIASTAALLRAGSAPAWLAKRRLHARLVSNGGEVRLVGGWPAQVQARAREEVSQ